MNCMKPYLRFKIVLYYESVLIKFIYLLIYSKGVTGMAQPGIGKKTNTKVEEQSSLKGTLASVFLLGFFLIITWVGVYFLFLDRF